MPGTKLTRKNRERIAREQVEFPNRGAVYRTKCCGELIQSLWRHDFVSCSCGGTYVDGGGAYTRIVWKGEPPEVVKCS